MAHFLGSKISSLRDRQGLTQDQFGSKYGVSGPAIYKFEKGYVKPSLELWLKFAADCGLTERQAVLMWCKAKLPDQYREFIEMDADGNLSSDKFGVKDDVPEYTQITDRVMLRSVVTKSEDVPQGLRQLLQDDDFWVVFKPTGAEIFSCVQKYGMFTNAPREAFADALRNIRVFLRDSQA